MTSHRLRELVASATAALEACDELSLEAAKLGLFHLLVGAMCEPLHTTIDELEERDVPVEPFIALMIDAMRALADKLEGAVGIEP